VAEEDCVPVLRLRALPHFSLIVSCALLRIIYNCPTTSYWLMDPLLRLAAIPASNYVSWALRIFGVSSFGELVLDLVFVSMCLVSRRLGIEAALVARCLDSGYMRDV
jgi:hypothetical protein